MRCMLPVSMIVAFIVGLILMPQVSAAVDDKQPQVQPTDVLADLLGATDSDAVPVARMRSGEEVVIRPLDDPENPYRGQYAAWDIWLMDNYQHNFDPTLYRGG